VEKRWPQEERKVGAEYSLGNVLKKRRKKNNCLFQCRKASSVGRRGDWNLFTTEDGHWVKKKTQWKEPGLKWLFPWQESGKKKEFDSITRTGPDLPR